MTPPPLPERGGSGLGVAVGWRVPVGCGGDVAVTVDGSGVSVGDGFVFVAGSCVDVTCNVAGSVNVGVLDAFALQAKRKPSIKEVMRIFRMDDFPFSETDQLSNLWIFDQFHLPGLHLRLDHLV
jgi:hypothetical protein